MPENKLPAKSKFLLFDFDGVLVDSFAAAFEVNKGFRTNPEFTEELYRSWFEGNIYEEAIKNDHGSDKSYKLFFDGYVPKLSELSRIDGVKESVEKLCSKYRMIIVSSTLTEPIANWLKNNGLGNCFEEILGADSHTSKVEKIKKIFLKYAIGPKDCLFVTDTLGDIREAEKAGVKSLAVTYGYHSKETLKKGSPVDYINKPEELLSKIEKYWSENL